MNGTPWWRRIFGGKGQGKGADHSRTGAKARGQGAPASSASSRPKGKVGKRRAPDAGLAVLGVTPHRGGWLGAVLEASGHGTPHLVSGQGLADVVARAGEVAVVAVDVPMGLPDDGRREADVQTREFLGPQASSVFTTPVREAVYAGTYGEANTISRDKIGSGVSRQAYELRRRIIEVDQWLREDLPFTVAEVHPEASFAVVSGAPFSSRKRSGEGSKERREALAAAGVYVPGTAPHGIATDEMIDACAVAWSAHRVKTGQALSFPEQPETFADGVPAAIRA